MTARGLLLALLFLATRVAAAPHFTINTKASRDTITPLQTIDYTIVVRNDGDSAPNYLRVTNRIPTSALLVAMPPEWTLEENRQLSWAGRIEAGVAKTFTLTFVTRKDSAGLTLSNMTEAQFDGAYANAFHDLQIESPPMREGITSAGIVVIGYIAFLLMAVVLIRMRVRNPMALRGWILLFIAAGFVLFFVAEARHDLRIRREFAATQCTVLDSSPQGVAVRYGDRVSATNAFATARGERRECWFDPGDPREVVLARDAGGKYLFAILPFLAIALAIFLIRR
ncbi:MAG TPA: hypothetical protein VHW00_07395 [Thermoanaerobaculia bacterium]|nr:hypothetical protein [Thermoanaerobaculia bacterium]